MKLGIGIILFIITTVLGALLLTESCGYCDNATISFQKQMTVVNGIIWIVSIVIIAKGASEYRKNKLQEQIKQEKIQFNSKKQQDDEIQKLKEKVEELEKDKEKKD